MLLQCRLTLFVGFCDEVLGVTGSSSLKTFPTLPGDFIGLLQVDSLSQTAAGRLKATSGSLKVTFGDEPSIKPGGFQAGGVLTEASSIGGRQKSSKAQIELAFAFFILGTCAVSGKRAFPNARLGGSDECTRALWW